jgi:molybdopterin/thiamine biosynthesis adenylyltransferase
MTNGASFDGSRFQRNIGILTPTQQEQLGRCSVAIGGVGGVGGITAERLVRLGIGRMHIADPETFEMQNLNRQMFSSEATLGRNKCEVFEEQLRSINPDVEIRAWPGGVTEQSALDFCDVDVVLDCVEYLRPEFSVYLHDAARERGIPLVSLQAIGFGSTVMVFDPSGPTFREWLGCPEATPATDVQVPPEKFCPSVPPYITDEVVGAVLGGRMSIPSTSIGVAAAATLASMATLALLLDLGDVPLVPDFLAFDPYTLVQPKGPRFERVRATAEVVAAAAQQDRTADGPGETVPAEAIGRERD